VVRLGLLKYHAPFDSGDVYTSPLFVSCQHPDCGRLEGEGSGDAVAERVVVAVAVAVAVGDGGAFETAGSGVEASVFVSMACCIDAASSALYSVIITAP
jgi:hypothetical protein